MSSLKKTRRCNWEAQVCAVLECTDLGRAACPSRQHSSISLFFEPDVPIGVRKPQAYRSPESGHNPGDKWQQGPRDWLKADAFRGFCAALGLDTGGSGLEMVVMWNVLACLICPIDAPPFVCRSQFLHVFDSGIGKVHSFIRKLCPAIEKADEESDIFEDYAHVPFWTARLRSRRARFGRCTTRTYGALEAAMQMRDHRPATTGWSPLPNLACLLDSGEAPPGEHLQARHLQARCEMRQRGHLSDQDFAAATQLCL